MVKIRKANEKDCIILEKIYSVLYKPEKKWSKKKIKTEIMNKKKEYYIILNNKKILGAIGLKFGKNKCQLGPLVINEKNQNKGYGGIALKFAERLVRKKGVKNIWCHSLRIYKARNFYIRNKWKQKELIKNFFDGQDCYVFEKGLK